MDSSGTTWAEAWGASGTLKGEAMADIFAILRDSSLFQTSTHTLKSSGRTASHNRVLIVIDSLIH